MVTVIENSFSRDGILNMIFTTAIEGGINYWADVIDYEWSDHSEECNMIVEFHGKIVDRESGDNSEYYIDRKVIVRGIRRAYDYYNGRSVDSYQWHAIRDLKFGHWEDVDFDADTADLIVQFGLFGGAIYG